MKTTKTKESSIISNAIESGAFEIVLRYLKNLVTKIQDFIYHHEKNLIQYFYSAVLFIIGIIFLSISVVFLIEEYLRLNKGWGFLIISFILILISFLIKNFTDRNKYFHERR